MYYCTNCHRVTPERAESCPYCDKFDRLRPAEEADECRLTELDALNASVMESLLKEANVPYIARPMMGAGISAALGVTLEKFVFFVAYRDYARAQEQLEALLAPDDHAADADFAPPRAEPIPSPPIRVRNDLRFISSPPPISRAGYGNPRNRWRQASRSSSDRGRPCTVDDTQP